jgi:hypothetical protein
MVASAFTGKPAKPYKAKTSVTVEDWYYKKKEYNALSSAQRKALHDVHEKRGKKPWFDCTKYKISGKHNVSAAETSVPDELSSDSSIKAKTKPTKKAKPLYNRDNVTLTCQKN